jgi:hypothetical protein
MDKHTWRILMKPAAFYLAMLAFVVPTAYADVDKSGVLDTSVARESVVRSRADLERYLGSHPASPINRLPPERRAAFLKSLVFTPKGLGSYSFRALNGSNQSQVRGVLSVFGLNEDGGPLVASSHGGNAPFASSFSRPPPKPRVGQQCIFFPGGKQGKCISGPGYRCSYLCK